MDLSIIIVNYNTKDLLKQCLDSLMKHPTKSSEMIVIDNASNDGSVEMIQRNFPNVRIITNNHNRGFGAANNQGAKIAKGKYLLFLNPDTGVERNFDGVLEYMEKNPKVGILGCRLVDETGKEQPHIAGSKHSVFSAITNKLPKSALKRVTGAGLSRRSSPTQRAKEEGPPSSARSLRGRRTGESPWQDPRNSNLEVDWVTGACLLVRRKVFEELGGFDEQFFMYFEDEDLCLRTKEKGWQVVYYPQFSIRHVGGAALGKDKKSRWDHYFQSQDLFYKKHHGLMQNIVLKILRWPLRKFFRE